MFDSFGMVEKRVMFVQLMFVGRVGLGLDLGWLVKDGNCCVHY